MSCGDWLMPACFGVLRVRQQKMHTKNKPLRQPELPLISETAVEALPEEVIVRCRQLLGQMLQEVLHAEKESCDEQ